ncbi:sigma-54-dependent transcriptional regulator [Brevibacillus sp. B_LB10_24]|uniref:sigma-54-dependent transcriptional regulator n=1 Tax=Brevibacillus sp. B_LB10_24 TaxID=3380645 RepID=UPI0038BC49B0
MSNPFSVLVVDDEQKLARNIAMKLKKSGFHTYEAYTGQDAIDLAKETKLDVVILDYMLTDMTGLDVLARLKEEDSTISVLMLTAYGNIESAVQAMKYGAEDYLNKPIELSLLQEVVKKACESKQLKQENQLLKEKLEQDDKQDELVFASPRMQTMMQMMNKVVETDASVLILGESGVGKTALAKWLHRRSPRREKPFVSLNCAAIPESLLESELFGYRKGAFTGAMESRPGKFEIADGGTIFLDEIGEVSLTMQAKLLHVIEDKSFMRLGSNAYRSVDVRIISATNKDIKQLIRNGKFREDLYYRLNLVELVVPPLRERKEDIPLLIQHGLQTLGHKYNKQIEVTSQVVEQLAAYHWPGNVRELFNMLERMCILNWKGQIDAADLPYDLQQPRTAETQNSEFLFREGSLPEVLSEIEEKLIEKAMERAGGNQTKAAQLLGISRNTLIYKLKKMHVL